MFLGVRNLRNVFDVLKYFPIISLRYPQVGCSPWSQHWRWCSWWFCLRHPDMINMPQDFHQAPPWCTYFQIRLHGFSRYNVVCSCGSRPNSASGHKGDLTPRVWRVTGESLEEVDRAHMLSSTLVQTNSQQKKLTSARPASPRTGSK